MVVVVRREDEGRCFRSGVGFYSSDGTGIG